MKSNLSILEYSCTRKNRYFLGFLLALSILLARTEGAQKINFFGYNDCILLKNDSTQVIITEHGARVLEYSLHGANFIYLDDTQYGWTYKEKGTFDPTGGRFDLGPEKIIPAHPTLWLEKWDSEIIDTDHARLTSKHDSATGVQVTRDFILDPENSHLRITQTIKNISNQPIWWSFWSRTFAHSGGITAIPLCGQSRFPHKFIFYGPGHLVRFRPTDDAITEQEGFLIVDGPTKFPKIGLDSMVGWFAHATKQNRIFIKKYPTYPALPYRDIAGITVSIYEAAGKIELEAVGPSLPIEPGAESQFTEEWFLIDKAAIDESRLDLYIIKKSLPFEL